MCTVRILGIPASVPGISDLPPATKKVVCDFLEVSNQLTKVPVYVDVDHVKRPEEEVTAFVDLLPQEYNGSDYHGLAVDLNAMLRKFTKQTMTSCRMVQTIVQMIGGGGYGYIRWDKG